MLHWKVQTLGGGLTLAEQRIDKGMKKRGFAYIVAVLILGLLAFMGLFLMQSSSAEYSQAAMFAYHTMAFQIAE